MNTYKTSVVGYDAPANVVFNKFSNLEALKKTIEAIPEDKIPDDKKAQLEQLKITSDTISLPAGPMGQLTFRMTEKIEPTLLRLEAEGFPIPLSILMHITPTGDTTSTAQVELNMDAPKMLAPMINGPLNKFTSVLSDLLSHIPMQ